MAGFVKCHSWYDDQIDVIGVAGDSFVVMDFKDAKMAFGEVFPFFEMEQFEVFCVGIDCGDANRFVGEGFVYECVSVDFFVIGDVEKYDFGALEGVERFDALGNGCVFVDTLFFGERLPFLTDLLSEGLFFFC